MAYDDVILHIGEFGRYQRRIFLLLCLPAICSSFHKMGGVFLSDKVDFRCLLPEENPESATFLLPKNISDLNFPWDDQTQRWSQCERYDFDTINRHQASGENVSVRVNSTVKCHSFLYDKSRYKLTTTTEVKFQIAKICLRHSYVWARCRNTQYMLDQTAIVFHNSNIKYQISKICFRFITFYDEPDFAWYTDSCFSVGSGLRRYVAKSYERFPLHGGNDVGVFDFRRILRRIWSQGDLLSGCDHSIDFRYNSCPCTRSHFLHAFQNYFRSCDQWGVSGRLYHR